MQSFNLNSTEHIIGRRPKISIVTTMYRSAPYLQEFYERSTAAVRQLTDDYEIIFVNDGSPDESVQMAIELHNQDSAVVVVDLSRNFGHHKAMIAGLQHAEGDFIFLIDSDLEEPPEVLRKFYDKLIETESDVVLGVQSERHDPWVRRLASRAFYYIFNTLSRHPIPANMMTLRLMTKRYVHALLQHQERQLIIAILFSMTGFQQTEHIMEKQYKGTTSYGLAKRTGYLISAIVASSNLPLLYISYLGLFLMIPSGIYILFVLFSWFISGTAVAGWLSVILSVWFLGGLNIFILGIIGLYVSIIFTEVKQRPLSIVRHVYKSS